MHGPRAWPKAAGPGARVADCSGINLLHPRDVIVTSLILVVQLYDTRDGTSFRTSLCTTVDWLTLV